MNAKSLYIDCSWGQVHYKILNPNSQKTVLCLHGWIDNWSSFLPLSQKLDCRLIAIDLPGHGLSGHISEGNSYHFVDYIVRLREIILKLKLKHFHIIGHSMGAGIASLYSSTFPEQIISLTMIDGLGPLVNPPEEAPDILRESILKQENKTLRKRKFPDLKMAIKARISAGDISYSSAEILVKNQSKKSEDGWSWTYDYKLKYTSSLRLTITQLEAFLKKIKCPSLIITAKNGFIIKAPYWDKRLLIENLCVKELSGGHHLHMDHPENTANAINQFYRDSLLNNI